MKEAFKIISGLEDRLNETSWISTESLSIYRIIFCLNAIVFGYPSFTWVGNVPQIFFSPPQFSPGAFFHGFPPALTFSIVDGLIAVLWVSLLFGYRTRAVGIALGLLIIFGRSFQFSVGKIDHQILRDITPILLAFSPWGNRFSIDAMHRREERPSPSSPGRVIGLSLLAFSICFGFFSAGFPKLLSWVDFDLHTQGARNWLIRRPEGGLLSPFFLAIRSRIFWEITDYAAVIFEIGFLFAWLNRKWFRLFLCGAVCFHFANWLMLGIAFAPYLVIYGAFVEWKWLKRLLKMQWKKLGAPGVWGAFFLSLGGIIFWVAGDEATSRTRGLIYDAGMRWDVAVWLQLLLAVLVVLVYLIIALHTRIGSSKTEFAEKRPS